MPVATGGNIITRGDNYVDYLVKKIQASPLWKNQQKKVAIVLMFDEGNATHRTSTRAAAGRPARRSPTRRSSQNADGTFSPDTSVAQLRPRATRATARASSSSSPTSRRAPKGIVDNDAYSHFSFVRTLQDMFLLADPAKDGSYMNRSKYTEKFIAQNILNLPEYAGSADTHFDSVRPMNHAYVIPASYTQKTTADDTQTAAGRVRTRRRPTSGRSSNVTVAASDARGGRSMRPPRASSRCEATGDTLLAAGLMAALGAVACGRSGGPADAAPPASPAAAPPTPQPAPGLSPAAAGRAS